MRYHEISLCGMWQRCRMEIPSLLTQKALREAVGIQQPCKVNCLRYTHKWSCQKWLCVSLHVCVWIKKRSHSWSTEWDPPFLIGNTWMLMMVQNWTYFVWRRYQSRWRCPRKCYRSHRWHMTHRLSPARGNRYRAEWVSATQTLITTADGRSLTHTHTVTAVCRWLTNCSSRRLSVPHCSNDKMRRCSIFILYI